MSFGASFFTSVKSLKKGTWLELTGSLAYRPFQTEVPSNDPNGQTVDPETGEVKQIGRRIEYLKIGDEIVFEEDRFLVEEESVYRVVTLAYLAEGGNGYPLLDYRKNASDGLNYRELTQVKGPVGQASFAPFGTEQDALAEYLKTLGAN